MPDTKILKLKNKRTTKKPATKADLIRKIAERHILRGNIGEGAIVLNTKEQIVMINESAADMLYVTSKWACLKSIDEVAPLLKGDTAVSDKDRPSFIAKAKGESYFSPPNSDYFFKRKDGTKFPVSIAA